MPKATQAEKDAQCEVDISIDTAAESTLCGRTIVSPRRGRITDESSWTPIVVSTKGPNRKSRPASADRGENGKMGLREVGQEGLTRRLLTGLIFLKGMSDEKR